MVMVTIIGIAEPANNWFDADNILNEYAKENNYNWDNIIDEENEIVYGLLTMDKHYLKENYGFDFDSHSLDEFCQFYENVYREKCGQDFNIQITAVKTAIYKDTDIYELCIISDENINLDSDIKITMARALFVTY